MEAKKLSNLAVLLRKPAKIRPKSVKSAKTKERAPHNRLAGIMIEGVRCCRLCKRPIPHKTKDANRFHMLAAKRRWMQAGARAFYAIHGYERFWKAGAPARRRRSVTNKTAIFREMAPLSSARMTDDDIARIALAFRNPKNGYMHGYKAWRTYIKKHYR